MECHQGKIDENKLFYIMTKGISYNDAKRLIIKANFYEILNNVKNEEIKNYRQKDRRNIEKWKENEILIIYK